MPIQTTTETPTYRLRVSKRIKRVKLSVCPYRGLEVVIPPGFPESQIGAILQQHQGWITRQLAHCNSEPACLPDTLILPALQQQWQLQTHAAEHPPGRQLWEESPTLLSVWRSPEWDHAAVLRQWLRHKGRQHLPLRLQWLAKQHDFHFQRCQIRSQKSRWGSCSGRDTISLNDRLLLAQPETVDYVLLHELCHTVHRNHSRAFWDLLAQTGTQAQSHRQALRVLGRNLPVWTQA